MGEPRAQSGLFLKSDAQEHDRDNGVSISTVLCLGYAHSTKTSTLPNEYASADFPAPPDSVTLQVECAYFHGRRASKGFDCRQDGSSGSRRLEVSQTRGSRRGSRYICLSLLSNIPGSWRSRHCTFIMFPSKSEADSNDGLTFGG